MRRITHMRNCEAVEGIRHTLSDCITNCHEFIPPLPNQTRTDLIIIFSYYHDKYYTSPILTNRRRKALIKLLYRYRYRTSDSDSDRGNSMINNIKRRLLAPWALEQQRQIAVRDCNLLTLGGG